MITGRALNQEEAKTRFDKIIQKNQISEQFGNYKILDAETDEFLGFAKLVIEGLDSDEAEIGYMILPLHWGKGIAGTVSKQLIERAKTQESFKNIIGIIDPENTASRKILTNNGFVSVEFRDFDGLPGEILELRIVR